VLLSAILLAGCLGAGSTTKGWAGVAIIDDTLIFASMTGKIYSVDANTGVLPGNPIALTVTSSGGLLSCGSQTSGVPIYASPVPGNNVVYISRVNGVVNAFSLVDGKLLEEDKGSNNKGKWQYNVNASIVGGTVLFGENLYFGTTEGRIYALTAAGGNFIWSFDTGGKIWSTPAVDSQHVYVGALDKKLLAINVNDGTQAWVFETDGAVSTTPVVDNGVVYFGSYDRTFYAVSAANGQLVWKFPADEGTTGAGNWYWTPAVIHNGIVYASNLDGKVYALDESNGSLVKVYNFQKTATSNKQAIASAPAVIGDTIVVAATDLAKTTSRVYAIDTSNQSTHEIANFQEGISAPLLASNGNIYIHTTKDRFYEVNLQSNQVRVATSEGWSTSVTAGK